MSNMDRKIANYLVCPGGACPLRYTCRRFMGWLVLDDEDTDEMDPAYKEGKCERYLIKEYYGG